MIRTLWVGVNLILATFSCASAAVVWGAFRPSPEFYNLVAQTWARWILWASAVRVRLVGLENLSLDQPQIVVANHVSWYDVFALAATLFGLTWLVWILWTTVAEGAAAISPALFTEMTPPPGSSGS